MNTHALARPLSSRVTALILFTALLLSSAIPTNPVLAATTPITVTINYLEQLGDFDATTRGDFYAEVTINGTETSTSSIDFLPPDSFITPTGQLLSSPWVLTVNVPSNLTSVSVDIEIWDSDWPDPDNQADIDPGTGYTLDLSVDIATAKWTGDVNWPQNCANGSTDLDGDGAGICFDISTLSIGGDIDEDGIPDTWEQRGIDLTQDGTIDLDLPAWGANPLRKDIFVEVDCLVAADHTHCPRQDSIEDVAYAFANAPVLNYDGTTGVQLHVDVGHIFGVGVIAIAPGGGGVISTYGDFGGGNEILETGNEIIESFASPKGNGVPFETLKTANFNDARSPIFHYSIFGHQTNARKATDDCTSGEASDIPGHDFMVTLGGSPLGVPTFPCWGANANGLSVGSRYEQAGTFMHELGHTLGLRHGGNESFTQDNPKPNYLSVMSYAFQMCDIQASPNGLIPGRCDYSRYDLPSLGVPLDESSLDECIGIGTIAGYGPVNWDKDSPTVLEGITNCEPPNNQNVQADINGDGIKILLGGFNDWENLNYIDGISGPGAGAGVPDEADPQVIQEARDALGEQMAPDIVVTKTGPATALPGDTLNYSVDITNEGFGPALEAVLTDTDPGGTSQETALGAILVGDTRTQNSSFTIPSDACPGDFTSADASVTFVDIVGRELTASGSAPLDVLDIVAPTLTVSVSPTTLWPPNHKLLPVTATITVTDNCDTDAAIVLVSITSNEPATGFLGNGDNGPDVMNAAFGTDDRTFDLRSERGTGAGNTGRVYTIKYQATDASGNMSEATVTVSVPTNNSGSH